MMILTHIKRCLEGVRERRPRSDGTLRDSRNSISIRSAFLEHAVPVESSSLGRTSDLVVNCNLNHVSPVGFDGWARESSIDEENGQFVDIRGNGVSGDSEVVIPSDPCVRGRSIGIVTGRGK